MTTGAAALQALAFLMAMIVAIIEGVRARSLTAFAVGAIAGGLLVGPVVVLIAAD